jgi:hypothetical protein
MSQADKNTISKRIFWLALIVLAVIAAASAGLLAYVSMNPQTITSVSTSFQTETSFITSYQTSTSYSTVTSMQTITAGAMGYPYGQNCYNSNYCQAPCYYCGYNSDINSIPCLITAGSNAAQCSGTLFISATGCVELVIPINAVFGGTVYQYYTLHNLPQSYPSIGSWVRVTGQLHQGFNTAPNQPNLACPGNYINVTSITQ